MVEQAKNYDYLKIEGTSFIQENLKDQQLLLSVSVKTDGFLFFKKNRVIILSDMYVYVCKDDKKRTIRFKDNYLNLEGVTATLRIGATNFIMHY